MNFQQLRIIRETARRNFNLTEVANALYLAQSGVSKHIKDLEDELGVELFVRRGKRLLGMTEPGKELLVIVERMLLDAQNIRQLADQFSRRDEGRLVIATTHTQARYAIPDTVRAFTEAFPKVHLALHQASPKEIVAMLNSGEADIGIATEALASEPNLVTFPFYDWRHAAVVPHGHPLTQRDAVSLADLTEHPIITYHQEYTGRAKIDAAFAAQGLVPDIVMSAIDADVIKTYVELGLGVGIIAEIAYTPGREDNLALLPTGDAFPTNTTLIAVRKGHYLRGFGYRFIEQCSPSLTEAIVRQALNPDRDAT
ncbi:MAG: CysB family HTH-type transcriptional regulator [Burkholderiaceae bacterium]